MRYRGGFKSLFLEILTLFGLLIFARGFLPPTRTKLGFSTSLPNVSPKFDRVIFMVVDAMRSDFLFSSESHMSNTHQLLRDGYGYAFTAFSDPPTVTLPRLKGLVTGASPNFLDAVLNIAESDSASTLANQDSWIYQLSAQGKRLHMYGDDTWLKLFPNVFQSSEGTSSFYVADFTEVDNNVTRHLSKELSHNQSGTDASNNSWDALILHYLGLDHIGHKGGPHSIHMPAKQKEMDVIIQKIFDSLDDSTLFIVAGDHGMNEVGNHGGASDGETSAALALFSKKFRNIIKAPIPFTENYSYYSHVYQIDIVPTIAVLLGFPIPKNSLGVFIEQFLELWSSEEEHKIIRETICNHLGIESSGPNYDTCTWENLKEQQRYLMKTSSVHILSYMYCGLLVIILATVSCLYFSYCFVRKSCSGLGSKYQFMALWWLVLPLLYFIGMLGSSTVEEEHYIWYWTISGLFATFMVALPRTQDKLKVLVLLVCFRIIRGWNSSGQKWTSLPNTAELLRSHPLILWVLVIITFAYSSFSAVGNKGYKKLPITATASILSLIFKFCATRYALGLPWMIWLARSAFLFSISDATLGTGAGLTIVFMLQTRLENIPMWMPMILARNTLQLLTGDEKEANDSTPRKLNERMVIKIFSSLVILCFEFSSFFAMGGSNSLATIDLSNGYNGVTGYNIPLVALLTYLGNWSGTVYWTLCLRYLSELRIFRAWFYAVSCLSVCLACLLLREHLFIWTVFAPKLLYIGAWLVFHELISTSLATICR